MWEINLSYKLQCYSKISSPEKSHNNARWKNTIFFHVCLISPISCWHVTRPSHHSVRLMNERQSLHHYQSKVVCRKFFGIMAAKTLKNPYRLQTMTFKLSEKGKKPKYGKKNRKLRIQWHGWWHFSRLRTKIDKFTPHTQKCVCSSY